MNESHNVASCSVISLKNENDGAVNITVELVLNNGTKLRPHCVIAPGLAAKKSRAEMESMACESLSSPDQIEDYLKHGRFVVRGDE